MNYNMRNMPWMSNMWAEHCISKNYEWYYNNKYNRRIFVCFNDTCHPYKMDIISFNDY